MKREKKRTDNKVVYGTVSLPFPLIKLVKEKIKGTGISSVSAYVSFVLRQILSEDSSELLNEKTEKEVKSRLKNLGYI